MTISTEAQARVEIRNIIKTAIIQYEQDCELNRVKRLEQVRDVGLPDFHAFNPIYTGPSIKMRVAEGILGSPTLIAYPAALSWGLEELVIHRLVTDAVNIAKMEQADEEAAEERARKKRQEAIDRTAAEKTKAKKRFWQFLRAGGAG